MFQERARVGGLEHWTPPRKAHRTTHLRGGEGERRASDGSLEPGSGVPKEGSGGWEVPPHKRGRENKVKFAPGDVMVRSGSP